MKLIRLTDKNYDVLKYALKYLNREIYNECGCVNNNSVGYIAHIVNMRSIIQTIITGEEYAILSDDDFSEICDLCKEVCEDMVTDEKFTYLMGRQSMKFSKAVSCVYDGWGNYICFYEDDRWVNDVGAISYDTIGVALAEMMCYGRDSCLYDNSGNVVAYTLSGKYLYLKRKIIIHKEIIRDKEMFEDMEIPLEDVCKLLERYEIICLE